MNLVDCVIRTGIHISNNTLETYEDYYQIGCEALCKAAMSYKPSVSTFQTYASRVIRNALIDHGRAMSSRQKQNSGIDFEEWLQGNEYGCEVVDDHGFQRIFDDEVLAALEAYSQNYTGVVKKGADAIRLKALGYSTSEIADMTIRFLLKVTSGIFSSGVIASQRQCQVLKCRIVTTDISH